MKSKLARILEHSSALLFDLDGPLSDVFAGRSASSIADELKVLAGISVETHDPMEVMQYSYRASSALIAKSVEDALIAAERDAIRSSVAEEDGVRALRLAAQAGYRVAIVTNNDPGAAAIFLHLHGLADDVRPPVAGRPLRHPELMKPHPHLLRESISLLRVAPQSAAFVGDTLTDVQAAAACGVACIAYANKPGKRALFEDAGAAAVIDQMAELVSELQKVEPRTTNVERGKST